MKALVGMSGGVDSSVAAYLLKSQGFEVVGVELSLWNPKPQEESDAKKVCDNLKIPYKRFDLQGAFKQEVVEYFCQEYLNVRTPNPCIMCNRRIKFGRLLDLADQEGARFLATGHYARMAKGPAIRKGADSSKDQSYALFGIKRENLKRILFPVGELVKTQTREIAEQAGLHVSKKRESQDICFIPDGNYRNFILDQRPHEPKPGPIVNKKGQVLGTHRGLINYTIGQRRGIGVAAKDPYYVIELRREDNALVIGFAEDTYCSEFKIHNVNWQCTIKEKSFNALAKIRYNAMECPAGVEVLPENQAIVRFQAPQRAVTPGQAAVIYKKDIVLGGGWIE